MLEKPAAFHPWKPKTCLEASGPDAVSFLQGQFTNDLRKLADQPAVYGLWLDRKGKCVADGFVVRTDAPERLLVVSAESPVATLREQLESHIIADDVTLNDLTDGTWAVTLAGAEARSRADSLGEGFLFPANRGLEGAWEWIGFNQPKSLTGRELSTEDMELARIEAGIPSVPRDAGPGDLPQEAGLDESAISHTKGCYLGQEVVARIRSLGQVKRRLVRVEGRGPAPTVPLAVHQGDRQVGELRSVVPKGNGFVGMAMISLPKFRPGEPLAFSAGGPEAMRVVEKS
jgi:folate-binding protein YgfZ